MERWTGATIIATVLAIGTHRRRGWLLDRSCLSSNRIFFALSYLGREAGLLVGCDQSSPVAWFLVSALAALGKDSRK